MVDSGAVIGLLVGALTTAGAMGLRALIASHSDSRRLEAEQVARSLERARWEGGVSAELKMLELAAADAGRALERIEQRFSTLPCSACHPGRRDTVERSIDDDSRR